ncbi:MAG: SpoIID/LytB domain-containing protein [Acidimicrobiales bacterium]
MATLIAACAWRARARADGVVLAIDGRGFGHGVGMSQDGAFWMASAGATTDEILGHFYPGTARASAVGTVRVVLPSESAAGTLLAFPAGGVVRDSPDAAPSAGWPVAPGSDGQVRVWYDGQYHAQGSGAPATATGPVWAVPARGTTTAVISTGRRYRGAIEVIASGASLTLVNQLDVEDYLRGMGEVLDGSWPQAALRAQAIVARTYALAAMNSGGQICDDDRCQVYLGAQVEYPAMDQAVAATRGQVVVFDGQLASTVYSANGGGVSATPEEGFGAASDSRPYLRAAPYRTGDTAPWVVRDDVFAVAGALGYPGQITAARVVRTGPSGRVLQIELDGSRGPQSISGVGFAAALGLRSTLFSLRIEGGAPDAAVGLRPASAVQVPPDHAASAAKAPEALLGPQRSDEDRGAATHAAAHRAPSGRSSPLLWVLAGGSSISLLGEVVATRAIVARRRSRTTL